MFVAVNLDPHHTQHGFVQVPRDLLERVTPDPDAGYHAHDLLSDARYLWRGDRNYVRFDPGVRQTHILSFAHA